MGIVKSLEQRWQSWRFSLTYIFGGVLLTHLVSLALPGVVFLPVLNGIVFSLLFLTPLRRGDYWAAARLALIWAVVTSIVQILLTFGWPELMSQKVWRGVAYREEMMKWVHTGTGTEGDIRLFLPIHARSFVVFSVLSLASGGLLGLVMGAGLLGHMNFYAGSLLAEAHFSWIAVFLSWPVWSVVRVVGFVLAGTAYGAVLLDKTSEKSEKRKKIIRFLAIGLLLIAVDVLLKWALADFYEQWLKTTIV